MKRRRFLSLVGSGAVAWPLAAHAQQSSSPLVGYLSSQSNSAVPSDFQRAFLRGLKDGGFAEGENVSIIYRWAENRPDQLPDLAADLIRRQVAVIVSSGGPASEAAVKATASTPIVFMVPEDPVRLGLVKSLARPGGNATGVNFFSAELAAKRLALLREFVPAAKRVAVLLNTAEVAIAAANRRDVEAAASAMGLQVGILNASTIAEIDAAAATFANEHPDALFISSGPFFVNRRVQLAHLATRYAVPAIASQRTYPEVGGLMSYGSSLSEAQRQAGVYVGLILKGAKPADLPVLQATKFEMVINLSTARMLGLAIPPGVLAIVDEVIE